MTAFAETPDIELVRQYAKTGDAHVFAEMVQRNTAAVYQTCYRILRAQDLAEDSTQETFFRLMRQPHLIHQSLSGWLHKTATRLCLDRIRHEQRLRKRQQAYQAQHASATEADDVTWAELSEALDQTLTELCREDHDYLVEHFIAGKPLRQIAEEQGVSAATAHRRVRRAVDHAKQALKERGFVAITGAVLAGVIGQSATASPVLPATLATQLGKLPLAAGLTGPIGQSGAAAAAAQTVAGFKLTIAAGWLVTGLVTATTCVVTVALVSDALRHNTPAHHSSSTVKDEAADTNSKASSKDSPSLISGPTPDPTAPKVITGNQSTPISERIQLVHPEVIDGNQSVAYTDGHIESLSVEDVAEQIEQQTGGDASTQ